MQTVLYSFAVALVAVVLLLVAAGAMCGCWWVRALAFGGTCTLAVAWCVAYLPAHPGGPP